MKKYFVLFVFLIYAGNIVPQCDSLQADARILNKKYKALLLYDDQMSFMTKCVKIFLECRQIKNAILWQESKAVIAQKNLNHIDELQSLQGLDSLMKVYTSQLSLDFRAKHEMKSLKLWESLYRRMGQYSKSLSLLKRAETLNEKQGFKRNDDQWRELEETFRGIGDTYMLSKEFVRSIPYYERALEISGQIEKLDSRLTRECLNIKNLAIVFLELELLEKGQLYVSELLVRSKELMQVDGYYYHYIAFAEELLAKIYIKKGLFRNANESINYVETDIIKNGLNLNSSFILRVELSVAKGEIIEARKWTKVILSKYIGIDGLFDSLGITGSLPIAKLLIKTQEYIQARKLLNLVEENILQRLQSVDSMEEPEFYANKGYYLDLLSAWLRMPNIENPDEISEKVKKGYSFIRDGLENAHTKKDKLGFANVAAQITDLYLVQLDYLKIEPALEAIENAKAAISFKGWLQNQMVDLSNNENIFISEKATSTEVGKLIVQNFETTDSSEIKNILVKIKNEQNTLDSIKQILQQKHPAYYQMKYDWKIPTLSEVQQLIDEDEVLVNYFEGEQFLYALVISNDTSHFIKMDSANYIRSLIDQYAAALYDETEAASFDKGNELSYLIYQQIVYPVQDYLKERVVISPSGSLHKIPFSALAFRKHNPETNPALDLLLSKYAISYTPSASFYNQQKRTIKDHIVRNGLFIAPSFSDSQPNEKLMASRAGFGHLNFNIEEAKGIAPLMNHQLLIGTEATKTAVLNLMGTADLIHLATHAKSNSDAPDKSLIAFATPPEGLSNDTSSLYLDELSKLHLPAKMIVLSACETGLGKIYKGEGAMSLANACFYAGAQSVVATLWSVNDKSSFDLVSSFYQYLDQGKPKDKALQLAKLDYLRSKSGRWVHPHYWAGFTVLGDVDSLEFKKKSPPFVWILLGGFLIAFLIYFLFRKLQSS